MKRKLLREIPKCHHRWICTNVYDDGIVTVQRRQTRRVLMCPECGKEKTHRTLVKP
jgi:hypothetical protein